uniref:BAH domain and coiled-coil containing 1a n=1 Tax=Sinocyclocheilus rhinocerous TaxID=307959 RepID=A0A673KAG9_9TELE
MEGRDFSAPAHLLSERATLVHRAASRISSSGHGSVQHTPHFPAGKYYPSHLPMAAHSGSGLMGNSSASFMGTFLASSLGSPPSHPPHPQEFMSVPGYPRFSGSLAHTFLPISHLDHHANSGVLYGQHRFYDTQKENFYLRSLPSQPPLISANHNIQSMSRAGSGQPQGSCSRERDAESGMSLQKGFKEPNLDRGVVSAAKDKDRGHKTTLPMEYKEHPQSMGKPLSACLLNGKMLNGDHGTGAKGSMTTYGGDGVGRDNVGSNNVQNRHVGGGTNGRCGKEVISGEMRISEQPPTECLERGQALQHSLPYTVPPPLPLAAGGGHPSGFHCLQLHPAPMGNPSLHDKGINSGGCRDPKVTGATFVPSVSHLGEKNGVPFQMGSSECQGIGGGGNSVKDKAMEKTGNGGHHETKTLHPLPNQANTNSQPYRDCSHSGPPTIPSPLAGKTMTQHTGGGGNGSCSMQRDGQKVARIRHQQHSRAGPDTPGTDMAQANGNQEMKRKMEMSPYGYNNNNAQHHTHQQPSVPQWAMQTHHIHSEENQHKAYMEPNSGAANNRPSQGEDSAMKNLLKYSNQQPLLLSQKSPFGGLGILKTGPNGTSCSFQGDKQTLPSRKGQSHESERADCGGRGREIGDAPHVEGEVRQPPVGIAVAVARQREPPCQASGSHPSSRQGRVHSTMKGTPRSMYPSDSPGEEERKRTSVEHMGHRDNKERVEFSHIHPSNSCHGDLNSHIMVPGGTSMQSSQLGDPTAHTHSAHHWMPRTGSPSLWMTGHSYGIGHTALHQNLPPGFSAAMPAPLQPVVPLPQDPSTQLVVLPNEPATHPATHLDVMEQPGLWPPVYRARGAHSHMQHPAVYPRSQFLRQQELYALQQHQQLQHQQHPKDILSDPRTPKPTKCYVYGPSNRASSPTRGSTAHLSPCCQSPCMRPHPKSTPSTPCPAPSPVAATHCSPAISPSPSQLPKTVESQEKRVEGQPPQDYPQSMEPGKELYRFGCLIWLLQVCPVKGTMDSMDGQELAMRVRLAELQQLYKEKQKELAKLQRKHDHQKEETPRSPARRGPGRPRKRKSVPAILKYHFHDTEEDEDEGSYGSEEGQDIKAPTFRDLPFIPAITGPSTFSVVKLEANQKAKIKRERQELYGSQFRAVTEGDVKVKRRSPCRSVPITVSKPSGVRRPPGRPRLQDKRWPGITGRPGHYRKSSSHLSFPRSSSSERLKRATRKSSMLRATVSNVNRALYGSLQRHNIFHSLGSLSVKVEHKVSSKGRAVSRLMESFAADEGFQLGEDSSFSEEDERKVSANSRTAPVPPNCILTKELLTDRLKILISKDDELLYAARLQPLESPDVYSIVIDGERGNRPRIYSLEQLLQEAVLDICPDTEAVLKEGTRVCAYWSERSRCLYPGFVRRDGDEGKPGRVMVEFDDGDRGWISLSNIRFLPSDYQIQCRSHFVFYSSTSLDILIRICHKLSSKTYERTANTDRFKAQEKPNIFYSLSQNLVDCLSRHSAPAVTWPSVAAPRKRMPVNVFQLNGSASKRALKGRVAETSSRPSVSMTTPAKGLFSSSSFEVDSFSSIANGYSSFGSQTSGISLEGKNTSYGQKKRTEEPASHRGKKAEFLVKLDHEGVTSPKTKNSKALLLLGASGFGSNGVGSLPRAEAYSHPVLLVKDNRKGDGSRAELLLKGTAVQRKPSPSLRMSEFGDLNLGCHRDCHSSYSDMDEEEEEVERRTGHAALAPGSGSLRTAGRFLSRISVSSSSSGSSSSSSSGSLSSSSLCSSENDSSYSSEDEESSTLLLQSCLTPHHSLLQTPEPPVGPPRHSFVAKAVAVSSAKGGHSNHSTNSKPQKRKECPSSLSKTSKDLVKRQRLLADQTKPRVSPILPSRQLWRWSGNPTQRRGLKGKARKLFYKAIVRGKDMVRVGDCAMFLSTGQPHLPLIGRIESFWESLQSSMVVKVQWFYHPEETKLGKRHRDGKHALYQSCHDDENNVQTISHKCQVVTLEEYERLTRNRKSDGSYHDLYYLAGTYDPTSGQLLTADGMSILC